MPRWRKVALALCLFFVTGSVGFLQPFTTPYFSAAGLTKAEIGLLTGLGTAVVVLIQPLLGKLSDRLDARRPLMIVAACSAAGAYLLFRFTESFWGFLFLLALGNNGFQYLNTVGGVLVGRLASTQGGGAAYARYRVWGSVGYILIGVTTGFLLPAHPGMSRADLSLVFTYGPLLFLLVAALSFVVPDPRTVPPASPTLKGESRGLPRGIVHFFVAFFLYQFALYGATSYLPLFMKSLGSTPRQISLMFAAGVLCEVAVMSQVGRWTDQRGRKPALTLAFLLMPLRLLLYIPATSPAWVMVVQSLHGLNFGIVGTLAVVYVNDGVTDQQRGTAQAAITAVSGSALSLSPALCGWLAECYGFGAMFGAMSAIGALGALYLLLRVPESLPHTRYTNPRQPTGNNEQR